jgi:hypothetical protein
MTDIPVQHRYAEELSHCYGCGKNNEKGLHIQTHWNGEQGLARFTPGRSISLCPDTSMAECSLRWWTVTEWPRPRPQARRMGNRWPVT